MANKEYQLSVDPSILELLGPNLYTNIYYALAELIANAYDANANNVYIIATDDSIRVEDDGHGMSYQNGEIEKFLNVAGVSRTNEDDSYTRARKRKKMGRKGVGKLAALSVSKSVDVLTKSNGDNSGFVLTRRPAEDNKLERIDDEEVAFEKVAGDGSAIVMKNPHYKLHVTPSIVKKNLIKIFPLVSDDFRIHLYINDKHEVVDNFDRNIMSELAAVITLGEDFHYLQQLVPLAHENRHDDLVEGANAFTKRIQVATQLEELKSYDLVVTGWIGAYKSTKGRKAKMEDFPDNYISVFANKKMGEFNILPYVGQNKLNEVYVVGQLHVDLLEETELPDIALSNRQGYKSDDVRYQTLLEYVRDDLLPQILRKRVLYSDLENITKKRAKLDKQKDKEAEFKRNVDAFSSDTSREVADKLVAAGAPVERSQIQELVESTINQNKSSLGLKTVIDAQKRRLLISQTRKDKPLSDVVYQMLLKNNVAAEDIIYSSCDDEISRIPGVERIWEYLRDFFVDSYSTEKIYVLFVTSENIRSSWGAMTEVGASWITQVDHKIFNILPFRPEHPLDDERQWHSTMREHPDRGEIWMAPLDADIFCSQIEQVCSQLGYQPLPRVENMKHLDTLIEIK